MFGNAIFRFQGSHTEIVKIGIDGFDPDFFVTLWSVTHIKEQTLQIQLEIFCIIFSLSFTVDTTAERFFCTAIDP